MEHHSNQEIDAILEELQRMDAAPPISVEIPRERAEESKWKKELLYWTGAILTAAAITFVIFGLIIRFVLVDGSSMEPTLSDGDRLLMYCLGYTPESGDIVILSDQTGMEIPLVKRVIATGGQTLDISPEGKVSVDGETLYEPYAVEQMKEIGNFDYPLTIPEGKIFVMGDNRNHSTDSRSEKIGLVDAEQVLGKVVFRLYPLDEVGPVS